MFQARSTDHVFYAHPPSKGMPKAAHTMEWGGGDRPPLSHTQTLSLTQTLSHSLSGNRSLALPFSMFVSMPLSVSLCRTNTQIPVEKCCKAEAALHPNPDPPTHFDWLRTPGFVPETLRMCAQRNQASNAQPMQKDKTQTCKTCCTTCCSFNTWAEWPMAAVSEIGHLRSS